MEFSIGSAPANAVRGIPFRERARNLERPTPRGRLLSDVFEVLPAGILIVSGDGRVLTWNPAVNEMLGDAVESARTCCEIFGCRRPGGPLAEICITELALARRTPLPEMAIETPCRPGCPIAVTATQLTALDTSNVVFELRPAVAHAPTIQSVHRLGAIHIRTLGETVVETPSGDIQGDWLDQAPGRLLKLLVAHRYTPMHSDEITEALWPRSRADSTNTVRHSVHLLRERLEPSRRRYERSAFVLARNGGYVLNRDRVTVDADQFEREARSGLIAYAANERGPAVERMQRALDIYSGDFLVDERFEDWAIAERERLRDLAARTLRILAGVTDEERAAGYLERLAEMEPLDVEIHRDLIALWLRQGRRGRATRHYRALQSRLMRELGERVTFDLTELARAATHNGRRAAHP